MEPTINDKEHVDHIDNDAAAHGEICSIGINTKDAFFASNLGELNQIIQPSSFLTESNNTHPK